VNFRPDRLPDRPLAAIRLFLSDSANAESMKRAITCIREGLWSSSPLGGVVAPSDTHATLSQFLSLSHCLDKSVIDENTGDEVGPNLVLMFVV
jgi:hypothetical protein